MDKEMCRFSAVTIWASVCRLLLTAIPLTNRTVGAKLG